MWRYHSKLKTCFQSLTGNVLIKNRTPSSDVPYLFGLPKQKTTLLRRTSVLRSKTLAEGEFTSPEHFNFLPESKKEVTTYVVTSFLERATRLARSTAVPRHAQRAPNAPLGRFLASLMPCSNLWIQKRTPPCWVVFFWRSRRDSNSRSLESESNALATVLRAEIYYCYYSGNANLVRIARIIFFQECRFWHFFCF